MESGVDGRLSPPNDVATLTESILWAGRNRSELREMGLRGLESVRHMTHGAMHRTVKSFSDRLSTGVDRPRADWRGE